MKKRKVKGSAGEFIVVMIGVVSASIFVMYFLAIISDYILKVQMDDVCRGYALQLESDGNLTSAQVTLKETEIANRLYSKFGDRIDDDSIVVTVTPNTYGGTISLRVECNVRLKQNRFKSFNTIIKLEDAGFSKYRYEVNSTSKT